MQALELIAAILPIVLWTAIFARAVWMARRTPALVPSSNDGSLHATVFVPARNEAEKIEACVRGIWAAGQSVRRIVVIDDGSTDTTLVRLLKLKEEVATLEVIRGEGPNSGECGKPAALAAAIAAARPTTEWLVFVDADVVLKAGAIDALLHHAESQAVDAVSAYLHLELVGVAEQLLMPSIGAFVAMQFPAEKVAHPGSRVAFLNGQFMAVRRPAYEAAGGHASVRTEILEDVALAKRLKQNGARLCLCDGRLIGKTRMYTSAREIRDGWSKNLFLILDRSLVKSVVWAVVSVAIASIGWIALVALGWPLGVLSFGFVIALQMGLRAGGGAPVSWAVLSPIAAGFLAYVILRSARLHIQKKRIVWKERCVGGREG